MEDEEFVDVDELPDSMCLCVCAFVGTLLFPFSPASFCTFSPDAFASI